jgi:hypothetical protein
LRPSAPHRTMQATALLDSPERARLTPSRRQRR